MSREEKPRYAAPALTKGLEILELLAAAKSPLSQGEISRRLGRTVNEQFRMLAVLEERGYIRRDDLGGYRLTLKLFSLANSMDIMEAMVAAAREPMRQFVERTGEECHLSFLEDGWLVVLAQEMGTTEITLHVRKGMRCNPFRTASGRLLLAELTQHEVERHWRLARDHFPRTMPPRGASMIAVEMLRGKGVSTARDESLVGLADRAIALGRPEMRMALASTCFHTAVEDSAQREHLRELELARGSIEKALGIVPPDQTEAAPSPTPQKKALIQR